MPKTKKTCQVCKEPFNLNQLYPVSLIRPRILEVIREKIPNLGDEGYICSSDLRNFHTLYYEKILKEDKGVLTNLEKEVLQSLKKQEILSEDVNREFSESLSFGERLADKIALFGGSWKFISLFGILIVLWMGINSLLLLREPFDPYPFILLNLVLSCLAAIQAPIIMMSQNRQTEKDRFSQENDYQVNLKSELQIRQLNARLELFIQHQWQKMHEIQRVQDEILREVEK